MPTVHLRLRAVGLATVQDLGRPGLGHLGIAVNGASDGWAAQVANLLVGNAVTAPLVEVTGSGLTLTADADLLLAATGATSAVLLDGRPQPAWETLVVPAGRVVDLPAPEHGLRTYLAMNGRLQVPTVLGSVAPDRLLGIGRTLRAGETLLLHSSFDGLRHPYLDIPVFRMGAVRMGAARMSAARMSAAPSAHRPLLVETTEGPDVADFPAVDTDGLVEEYEVSAQSDAIGLRLLGPTPPRTSSQEILSRGMPVGAIEVPPAGGLLLLLRARLVTAGYPVVGVATLASIDRLGQACPGDHIRFTRVDRDRARDDHRRRLGMLEALDARVRTALTATGLGRVLSPPRPHTPRGEEP